MLEQQIQEDIKAAMKAKDAVSLAAARAIKGEILLFKTAEGGNGEVTDADVLKMIQKLIKQRKESAEQYTAAGRQELADNELAEAAAMEKYLPKQLSVEEVKAKVAEIITQVGATSIKDMGKVMGAANKALAGQSDGRTISTVVKELLLPIFEESSRMTFRSLLPMTCCFIILSSPDPHANPISDRYVVAPIKAMSKFTLAIVCAAANPVILSEFRFIIPPVITTLACVR